MLNMKRWAALGMAAMMTLGLGMSALAASSEPNFTNAPGTAYSTPVVAGGTAKLEVGPANDEWSFVGYRTNTEAVNDTGYYFNCGEDMFQTPVISGARIGRTYATHFDLTAKDTTYGVASLHTYNKNNTSASVDLTVYVESTSKVNDATGVYVQVDDVSGLNPGKEIKVSASGLEVKPANQTSANPYAVKPDGSAQTYPTAGDALYSLSVKEAAKMSFDQAGGYVSVVTNKVDNVELKPVSVGFDYYGWNYCVIVNKGTVDAPNFVKVAESEYISASVLPITENAKVYWAYGTSAQANTHFADILNKLNTTVAE